MYLLEPYRGQVQGETPGGPGLTPAVTGVSQQGAPGLTPADIGVKGETPEGAGADPG